ncbi:hypothetical protein F4U96_06300 [Sphingobium limneticum]|uniref:Uncharacterized protein n=2 Tax=Sphingobium limneticum TaxID=1007511 RepID=A0A5J5I873_9SPHN|nr:hypothetical protein [Sphingobium limneticum]KAA9019842.1 hypothetical protein F4U96_06300 [Sphingobium limneticum]KAA9032300.1 hypothetical protein F4U95_06300 [Sphingobium limneticum]
MPAGLVKPLAQIFRRFAPCLGQLARAGIVHLLAERRADEIIHLSVVSDPAEEIAPESGEHLRHASMGLAEDRFATGFHIREGGRFVAIEMRSRSGCPVLPALGVAIAAEIAHDLSLAGRLQKGLPPLFRRLPLHALQRPMRGLCRCLVGAQLIADRGPDLLENLAGLLFPAGIDRAGGREGR